jgi:hypothetical protein
MKVSKVRTVFGEVDLPIRRSEGGSVEVLVPRVPIYEVLSFEKL